MNKTELLSLPISFYRHKTSAEPKCVSVGQVLEVIRGPFYESQITTIRKLKAQGKQAESDEVKNNLHAVTFCAYFPGRRLSGLYQKYNNLMVLDIDKLSEEEMIRQGGCLESCSLVAAFWKSPSGAGYKGLVPLHYLNTDKKIDVVEMHHWAFKKLEEKFKTDYDIELDPSGKDITRLCFMSWCPEMKLKDEFEAFDVDIEELKVSRKTRKESGEKMPVLKASGEPIQWNLVDGQKQAGRTGDPYDRRLLERIYKYLATRNLSITDSYHDWVKVAFAIAQTFHSTYGRKMFMKLCELDGPDHNMEKSERLIYDAYTTEEKRCDFSTIVYLATRKGFIR